MTDDLVKRLRLQADTSLMRLPDDHVYVSHGEAADRIKDLEYALRSIADTPIGFEIPDRTTIWGLAVHMQETAKAALKEGKDEQR